jgi:hypothetical protein
MTVIDNTTPRGGQYRKIVFPLVGIATAISAFACMVVDTGTHCRTPTQAYPPGCINYFHSPNRSTCEEYATGTTGCLTEEVACLKDWQQQILYTPGTGPAPERTTNYCANPGAWHKNEPDGTTLKATAQGSACPTGG